MGKVKTNFKTKRRTFIKQWRLDRKLTLERLAERIEVTAGALSQLERGDVGYTQPMLEALAAELRCEPADHPWPERRCFHYARLEPDSRNGPPPCARCSQSVGKAFPKRLKSRVKS